MSDDTKQTQEVSMLHDVKPAAKRTAKNSVFLDLSRTKKFAGTV